MIGVYDFTVVLTYLSLVSASFGIFISLQGHPYIGSFFLLFCGLCDAFDGKVARMKHNRTEEEKKFGIQIDSLSDLVAFGVLPACIGATIFNLSDVSNIAIQILVYTILAMYALAALIRLAYFNVTEEERQNKEDGVRKTYTGLPVTSAALIFPTILLLQYILNCNLDIVYYSFVALTGVLFLLKFQMKKLGTKEILVLVFIGLVEFILMLLWK